MMGVIKGKVQEEELDSCRAGPASEGRQRDEGAGRNPSGFSLRDFRAGKDEEAAGSPPLGRGLLGRLLGLGNKLWFLLGFRFGNELLFHLLRDGIRVHLVGSCSITKHGSGIHS
jgi:hypothetical protein